MNRQHTWHYSQAGGPFPTEPSPAAASIYVDADLARLGQIFSNLLTNSVKYTPTGGKIWIETDRSGDKVSIAVRDTGIGIPSESRPGIFDMFSQLDRSIERSRGGLGIGLALVKGLIEMHGGSIAAESGGTDRGSTFVITLPALPNEDRRSPAVG